MKRICIFSMKKKIWSGHITSFCQLSGGEERKKNAEYLGGKLLKEEEQTPPHRGVFLFGFHS